MDGLNPLGVTTTSCYFYGKIIARAARLALIAEEVAFLDAMTEIKKFLKESIEPWLDGTFSGNGFLYDGKWGGIVTKHGSKDSGAEFVLCHVLGLFGLYRLAQLNFDHAQIFTRVFFFFCISQIASRSFHIACRIIFCKHEHSRSNMRNASARSNCLFTN